MTSWTMFVLLWVALGVTVLLTKKHPIVSLFLSVLIVGGCGYMIAVGENGGAIVTLFATLIVLILRFMPHEHQEA